MDILTIISNLGEFGIRLIEDRAPATCAYFAYLARSGFLDDSSIFRIVAPTNHRGDDQWPINIVQVGPVHGIAGPRHRIIHESTNKTGLSHTKWTVSAARYDRKELYGSFFICMRDEPALDFGGARHPDGQGFAAFGEVISGFETIEKAYRRAEGNEFLQIRIPVSSISLSSTEASSRPIMGNRRV